MLCFRYSVVWRFHLCSCHCTCKSCVWNGFPSFPPGKSLLLFQELVQVSVPWSLQFTDLFTPSSMTTSMTTKSFFIHLQQRIYYNYSRAFFTKGLSSLRVETVFLISVSQCQTPSRYSIFMKWIKNEIIQNPTLGNRRCKYKSRVYVYSVVQLCPTLCDPTDCRPPGSSVQGSFLTRIMEWLALSFSQWFSDPKIKTVSPASACWFLTASHLGIPQVPY